MKYYIVETIDAEFSTEEDMLKYIEECYSNVNEFTAIKGEELNISFKAVVESKDEE